MKSGRRVSLSFALFAVHVAAAVPPGHLDPGFGVDGKQVVPVNMGTFGTVNAVTTLVGPDERIYVVGTALVGNVDKIAIVRLDADGAVDLGFGEDGAKVFLPDGVSVAYANDATFDSEGRLVVVGQAVVDGDSSIIACRFAADGDPDLGFGRPLTPGCYSAALDGGVAHSVVVQHGTGRVIMAGSVMSAGQRLGVVVALAPDGAISDSSFGVGFGLQFIPIDNLPKPTQFLSLAQSATGELAVVGSTIRDATDHDFLVYRLDAEGQAVAAFDEDGVRTPPFGLAENFSVDEATAVSFMDDGALLVGGVAQKDALGYRPGVIKIHPDGENDLTFHYDGAWAPEDGRIVYDLCDDVCNMRAEDIKLLSNGNIVLTGSISSGVEGDNSATLSDKSDFFALRLLPNGKPDPTFRSPDSPFDGLSIIPFDRVGPLSQDSAFSLAVQGDKLLVAGFARIDDNPDDAIPDFGAAIARLGNGDQLFADGFE